MANGKKKVWSVYFRILRWMLLDAVIMNAGMLVAVLIGRYEAGGLARTLENFVLTAPIMALTTVFVFYAMHNYRVLWKYAGIRDVYRLLFSVLIVELIYLCTHVLIARLADSSLLLMEIGIYPIGSVFSLAMLTLSRLLARQHGRGYSKAATQSVHPSDEKRKEKLLIVGGGDAGALIIRDLKKQPERYDFVGIVDDAPEKQGQSVYGVRVLGTCAQIPEIAGRLNVDTILFCIAYCTSADRVRILNYCVSAGCQVKVLPSMAQLIDGKIDRGLLRRVQIEDLLERDPIRIDNASVMEYVRGRTVLVTGGGGSIGSELCRQIAANAPRRLVIFDIYENNAYAIENELKRTYPALDLQVLIGSVRDEKRLDELFSEHRPEIVFHAAAHKHVPLMENSPKEAIKNNVFGTLNTVKMADEYGVDRFVLISTDKAVNPTNVMGATKRVCEMIVQTYDARSETEYVAVRFGNVLGSNGSVVPLFKDQIAKGGPVTVTHPDIIRYFMTIPEAVALVLQAGALAKGGEIFVLDMGKPVRILDMAEKLIRLSGYEPYTDIKIEFSGMRPGEKLYEELLMDEEGLSGTENALIHIGKPIKPAPDFLQRLERLREDLQKEDFDAKKELGDVVPTYHPDGG